MCVLALIKFLSVLGGFLSTVTEKKNFEDERILLLEIQPGVPRMTQQGDMMKENFKTVVIEEAGSLHKMGEKEVERPRSQKRGRRLHEREEGGFGVLIEFKGIRVLDSIFVFGSIVERSGVLRESFDAIFFFGSIVERRGVGFVVEEDEGHLVPDI